MSLRILLATLTATCAAAGQFPKTPTGSLPDPAEGKALQAELLAQRPGEDSVTTGVLKIRDRDGQRTEVPIKLEITLLNASSWQATYSTTGQPRAEKLLVLHEANRPNRYWLSDSGVTEKPAPLTPEQAARPFAGSDFWPLDLGLEFFHWPGQTLVKKEMTKGRSCKVLDSADPRPQPGSYARVRSWIDMETGGLVRAEAYDGAGKLLKEFTVRSFKKVNGHWQLKEMEIRTEPADSRTRLEFELELK